MPCKTIFDLHPGWNIMQESKWSEIYQHFAIQYLTYHLDGMLCKVIRKLLKPCKQQLTHQLDGMLHKIVRNSPIPCKTTINSLAGWNIMQNGQKSSTPQDNS